MARVVDALMVAFGLLAALGWALWACPGYRLSGWPVDPGYGMSDDYSIRSSR